MRTTWINNVKVNHHIFPNSPTNGESSSCTIWHIVCSLKQTFTTLDEGPCLLTCAIENICQLYCYNNRNSSVRNDQFQRENQLLLQELFDNTLEEMDNNIITHEYVVLLQRKLYPGCEPTRCFCYPIIGHKRWLLANTLEISMKQYLITMPYRGRYRSGNVAATAL